jgi:hypothetical protein
MLCELRRIIVQQIAQGIHRFRDGRREGSILSWQIFGKSNKKVKRSSLLPAHEIPELETTLLPTLKEGMSS